MRSKNRNFKLVAAGALLCATTCAIFPAPTHAANGWEIDLKNYADTLGESSISISIGGANNEILNADKGIAQGMIKQTANVEFGATNGYTVKISGTPNLTGASTKATIPSAALTLGNMTNQWGWYAVNGVADCSETNVYRAMTSAGTQIDSGVLADGGTKTYTMCFGMRVNGNQAADTYNGSVTVSAVAEPGMVRTAPFSGITYMQDMTANICKLADENETAQLIDRRDNKKYWVTKLRDGNCWMSQNLDFDISADNVTAATSDVTSNWTSSSTYPARATVTTINSTTLGYGANDNTGTFSWDLGNYVITSPTVVADCDQSDEGLSSCAEQFSAIGGRTPSGDPNFYRTTTYSGGYISDYGQIQCSKPENSPLSTDESGACAKYDAHYLVGNYYQWNAATAGAGGTKNNAAITDSVCPKGWKLPLGALSNTRKNGGFRYLAEQYGLISASSYGTGAITGTDSAGNNYNIALSPLFFVRSGGIYPDAYFKLGKAGGNGNYWTSEPYPSTDAEKAYYLLFNTSSIIPYNTSRSAGYSLRCLIPTT